LSAANKPCGTAASKIRTIQALRFIALLLNSQALTNQPAASSYSLKSEPGRIANFVRSVNAKIVLCQPHLWRRAKSNDDVVEISSERSIIRLARLLTKAYVTGR
jgi:hypothetical protein